MRIDEVDLIGKKTPEFKDIMRKHNANYSDLMRELGKGMQIEKEHTGDIALAREIALDHLNEYPDYYTRLEQVEK